ncbi:armadillo-type protein [Myxozyma melibiosi]|uniref:Nucleolar protein 9 n=1 Tax=Myxozyma melibiosi TaxID=54550 RepID=A0ABR1FE03_9ASCO
MPKENKKRGRRLKDKPYKKEDKAVEAPAEVEEKHEFSREQEGSEEPTPHPQAFYGLLDSTQIEYFTQATGIIDANTFSSDEERDQLYDALWNECSGIELKVVTDPTGSKVFERLLLVASKERLLETYQAFASRVAELATQRFASHCLQTWINRSRALVDEEMKSNPKLAEVSVVQPEKTPIISNILDMYTEIKPEIYRVAFHPFGSHVFRTLLLALSGTAIEESTAKSVMSNKKVLGAKKKTAVDNSDKIFYESYETPLVFKDAVLDVLAAMLDRLTTDEARRLASDPISSPVVQLIIEIEDSLMRKDMLSIIFPTTSGELDFITVSYLESLLSSSVGCHFLENILHSCPISFVDYLCFSFFVPRLDIVYKAQGFSFAVKAIMERLNKSNTAAFGKALLARVNDLSLPNIIILNSIIIAISRHSVLEQELLQKITNISPKDNKNFLLALLEIDDYESITETQRSRLNDSIKQRSLFVESLITHVPELSTKIVDAFIQFPESAKLKFMQNTVFAHVAESIYKKSDLPLVSRKRLMNDLDGHFVELSCGAGSSRVVDACNITTAQGMNHYREKIAKEFMAGRETLMRNPYGKIVWRNWNMDMYKRDFGSWKHNQRR